MFVGVTVEDCRFDDASLVDAGFWDSTISETTFRRADLRGLVMGGSGTRPTRWQHVEFDGAKLVDVVPFDVELLDCDFGAATLRQTEFSGCRVERCGFAGLLDSVIISALPRTGQERPGVLEEVDFSDAEFRWTSLRGFDLQTVRLPDGPGHVRFADYPCTIDRALEALAGSTDPDELGLVGLLEHERRWLGPSQRQGVLAVENLAPGRPDVAQRLADRLRTIDAGCAGSPKPMTP